MKVLTSVLLCAAAVTAARADWQGPVPLVVSTRGIAVASNNAWCIAASYGLVHLVWSDLRDGNWEVYYKRSSDWGEDWGADTRLTNAAGSSRLATLAISESTIHVVWQDDRDSSRQLYYIRSTDAGSSWGPEIRLTRDSGNSDAPSLAAYGGCVHLIWYNDRRGSRDLYYKRSTDGGGTWEPDSRLTTNYGDSSSIDPSIAACGDHVNIIWADNRTGNTEVYYRRSTDRGTTWCPETAMVMSNFKKGHACIAASDSFVHLIWFDHRGDDQIYYRRSTDYGSTWDPEFFFSGGMADNPSIAVADAGVHVAWPYAPGTEDQVYCRRSVDYGHTWETGAAIDDNVGFGYPVVAVSGPVVHVAWTAGNTLFYQRNPNGNPAIDAEVSGLLLPDSLDEGPFPPVAQVTNYGSLPGKVQVCWEMLRDDTLPEYFRQESVHLDSGESGQVEFPSWKATRGQYLAKVFLSYRGMRSCDTVRKSFHVFAGIAESRGDRGLAQVLSIEIPTPISCDKPLKVGFDLPLESDIRLALYDAIGRRKATVAQGRFPAGRYISSTAVSGPGVWYIRIELQSPGRGPRTLTRKVVVAE